MNEKKPGNPWAKSLMIWMAVLFGLVLLSQMFGGNRAAAAGAIPYSQFISDVNEGSVQAVTIAPSQTGNMQISGKMEGGKAFTTTAPPATNVADRLIAKGVAVQVKTEEQSSFWLILLYQSLPFLIILGISFFVMRQMQKNAGGGAMGFG